MSGSPMINWHGPSMETACGRVAWGLPVSIHTSGYNISLRLDPVPKVTDQLRADYPHVVVWAAGGLIGRLAAAQIEILLAHRPNYHDWTFPKGKLDEGETLRCCALREVQEETGMACTSHDRLAPVFYRDARDRDKAVVYWTMTVDTGAYVSNDEVDAIGWFDLDSAAAVLTYARDRALLLGLDVERFRSTMQP